MTAKSWVLTAGARVAIAEDPPGAGVGGHRGGTEHGEGGGGARQGQAAGAGSASAADGSRGARGSRADRRRAGDRDSPPRDPADTGVGVRDGRGA
ncbi:hypothetical protein [Curtobacterium sp. MCPF17_052]|uniref:hypothetical protein n=1 Tax=Curtobacterium sp. MCPF17_052 TaxID=2175655 RepID=UPI0024DFA752|nr:hypothetical protein [Curtobacterium sp. MCPF17_052]WIB13818.1 hypothetical protein DEJ36_09260 [Curtobacterium sp. MCPF17_052]